MFNNYWSTVCQWMSALVGVQVGTGPIDIL